MHGEYRNERGELVRVDLLSGGDWTQEAEIGQDGLFFAEGGVEIEGGVDDTFAPLWTSQASIRLLTRDWRGELWAGGKTSVAVNIRVGGKLLWAGWMEPQTYSQGYAEALDELELNGVDALGVLEDQPYGGSKKTWDEKRQEAKMRSIGDIVRDMLGRATAGLDILGAGEGGGGAVDPNASEAEVSGSADTGSSESGIGGGRALWYDGSKSLVADESRRWGIFDEMKIDELLMLGDEEDDCWTEKETLEEILRYLGLHMICEGLDFYAYSWESVKLGGAITWKDVWQGGGAKTQARERETIRRSIAGDGEAQLSVGDVWTKISVSCPRKEVDSAVESPLSSEGLKSRWANWQLYLQETFAKWTKYLLRSYNLGPGDVLEQDGMKGVDWYMRGMKKDGWKMSDGKGGDMTDHEDGGQEAWLSHLGSTRGATGLVSVGAVETDGVDKEDNSLISKLSMETWLVVSVKGNGSDETEENARPSDADIRGMIPCATYEGTVSGGVMSPSDAETTNYLVISGRVVLNPRTLTSLDYADYKAKSAEEQAVMTATAEMGNTPEGVVKAEVGANGKNYYGRRWLRTWQMGDTGGNVKVNRYVLTNDEERRDGLIPWSEDKRKALKYSRSVMEDGSLVKRDLTDKVDVLQLMLRIGDKVCVETDEGTYEWRKWKSLAECSDEDEYYAQSFSLGMDIKLGDYVIGQEHAIWNGVDYGMGIDAEGTAIPMRMGDHLAGRVRLEVLGPVQSTWNTVTKRHKTLFRHTKWTVKDHLVMANVENIIVKDLEMKVVSDNGLAAKDGDESDLVYTSQTDERWTSVKDDIEMRINSALTRAERESLGVSAAVSLSTAWDGVAEKGVTEIYDWNRRLQGKAEKLYVDAAWKEWHAPRVELRQSVMEDLGIVSPWALYEHPALGKTLFVEGIERELTSGVAELTLKEIENTASDEAGEDGGGGAVDPNAAG